MCIQNFHILVKELTKNQPNRNINFKHNDQI